MNFNFGEHLETLEYCMRTSLIIDFNFVLFRCDDVSPKYAHNSYWSYMGECVGD